jgi:anti-sigma factor RsiW
MAATRQSVTAERRISHARARLLASRTAHGEVTMAELRMLAAHLEKCAACAKEVREMSDLYALLARTSRRRRRRRD